MWVGLDLCDGLNFFFFLTHHGGLGRIFFDPPWWVGSKNPLTMHTPTFIHLLLNITKLYILTFLTDVGHNLLFNFCNYLIFIFLCKIHYFRFMTFYFLVFRYF